MNLSDLQAQIRDARTPLRITGHGSKDFYGEAPAGEPLSTLALNGVTAYEPSELFVSVLAGTPVFDVEALLAQNRQRFAFEPPRFGAASTIGGVAADWTQIIRGRSGPITPSASSSAKAFHIPSTPVPPPVG